MNRNAYYVQNAAGLFLDRDDSFSTRDRNAAFQFKNYDDAVEACEEVEGAHSVASFPVSSGEPEGATHRVVNDQACDASMSVITWLKTDDIERQRLLAWSRSQKRWVPENRASFEALYRIESI